MLKNKKVHKKQSIDKDSKTPKKKRKWNPRHDLMKCNEESVKDLRREGRKLLANTIIYCHMQKNILYLKVQERESWQRPLRLPAFEENCGENQAGSRRSKEAQKKDE